MKRILPTLLAIALSAACSADPATQPASAHVTPFMSVQPPAGDDWEARDASGTRINYARGRIGDTYVAGVSLFQLAPTATPADFEALIRDANATDVDPDYPDRYEPLELGVAYTDERPYPCVRYRAVSRDHRAKGTDAPQYLELDGLYCRHPMDPSAGVAIVYSHRGLERDAHLRRAAEAFIQGTTLPTQ